MFILVKGVIIELLERRFPSIPDHGKTLRTWVTDLSYHLLKPHPFLPWASYVREGFIVFWLFGRLDVEAYQLVDLGPFLEAAPAPLRVLVLMLIFDFLFYWFHRATHAIPLLWRLHVIHHSSTVVTWTSQFRFHPLDNELSRVWSAFGCVLLGVPLTSFLWVLPAVHLIAYFVHANIRWEFGPLRYLFITPIYHRWHHTAREEGLNKNFVGMFPIWDILFGTAYMPAGKIPRRFGIIQENVPEHFLKQLLFPFVARKGTMTLWP